jgi:hypothetical protein
VHRFHADDADAGAGGPGADGIAGWGLSAVGAAPVEHSGVGSEDLAAAEGEGSADSVVGELAAVAEEQVGN